MFSLSVISHKKTSSSSYPKWQNRWAYIVLGLLKMCPFYQCIADHFEERLKLMRNVMNESMGSDVISEVIQKFLECGNLTHGSARIRCDHCGQTLLLAFSCKGRYYLDLLPYETSIELFRMVNQ